MTGLYLHFATWLVFISPPTCLGLLIVGIFSGTCCVDVAAKLGHVLGDVAEADFHGNARGCTERASRGAFDLHSSSTFPALFLD